MNTNKALSKKSVRLIVTVVLMGGFITILNQTLLAAALPSIMNYFQITANHVQWLTTGFMLVNGIMIPITAFLINKLSNRTLFISAMSVFACGTAIGIIAPNFEVLLCARVLQAIGAGVMMPMMQTIMLYVFPKEKRGFAMGIMGIVIGLGPAIGPTLSGFLVDTLSWHALFYVVLPVAILDIIFAVVVMQNLTEKTNPKLDILSVILSSIGFGGLLYGFSIAGDIGWSAPACYLSIIIGAIVLVIFVMRQLKIDNPLLELRVFKNKSFLFGSILTMASFALMISIEIQLPMYIQTIRGYPALISGLTLLPGAICVGIMSPINGKIFDKLGPRFLGVVGLFIVTTGSLFFTRLSTTTPLSLITIVYSYRMIGLAMVQMPMLTWAVNGLSNQLLPHGTAVTNTLRQITSSMVTALLVTIMTAVAKASLASGVSTNEALAMLKGMQASFFVTTLIALVLFLLSLVFVHDYEGISARSRRLKAKANK